MLADRASQLEAEEEAIGRPAVWEGVYKKMRCPDRSCPRGPHCWQDGEKHYKLNTTSYRASSCMFSEVAFWLRTTIFLRRFDGNCTNWSGST
jgi:hypothetical protein